MPQPKPRRSPGALLRRTARGLSLGLLSIPGGLLAAPTPIERIPVPAAVIRPAGETGDATAIGRREAATSLGQVFEPLRRWSRWQGLSRQQSDVQALADALAKCRSDLGEKQRWRIARAIEREARRAGYDPLFVQALVEVESTCKPTAKSPRGAVGLTQVRPSTARAVAREAGLPWRGAHTLLDPETNLRLGLYYLSQLHDQFGDMHLAIAAYNFGPARAGSMSRDRARRTQYVRKILDRYEDLVADGAA